MKVVAKSIAGRRWGGTISLACSLLFLLGSLSCSRDGDHGLDGSIPEDASPDPLDDWSEGEADAVDRSADGTQDLQDADFDDSDTDGAFDTTGNDGALPEACLPYESIRDDALLRSLYNEIRGHTSLGYTDARQAIFTDIDVIDGRITCVYSGETVAPDGTSNPGSFDTEHSWPQGQFDQREPPKSDLHHLFPTVSSVNGARAAWDFGETDDAERWFYVDESDVSELGPSVRNPDQTVFEVRPSRRGDIARAHFYMVARYRFDPSIQLDDTNHSDPGSIDDEEEDFLRQWHQDDPVDDTERRRNEDIERYQHNRNPFVDCPLLVGWISDF